jgi:transcriptional regulator of acetoin/glycerol metabolism
MGPDPARGARLDAVNCPACGHSLDGLLGRPRKLDATQLAAAAVRLLRGDPLMEVARDLDVSRATLYRRLKEWREQAA